MSVRGQRRLGSMLAATIGVAVFLAAPPAYGEIGGQERAETTAKEARSASLAQWNFDTEGPGQPPTGFSAVTVGATEAGEWRVIAEPRALSEPHVLRQLKPCPAPGCLHLLLAEGTAYEYLDFSVRIKAADGAGVGSSGIVIGASGGRDFYAVLVEFSTNVIEIVRFEAGEMTVLGRGQVKRWEHPWHLLRVQRNTIISNEFIETYFDNKIALSVEDTTLRRGQIGFVTRGDTVFEFDNARAIPLYSHRPVSPPAAY